MANYSFRNVPVTIPVTPDDAVNELERIRVNNDGKLTPPAVVKASVPKDAVLHDCFEWRNAVAADYYRQWQARQIIKIVRYETVHEGKPHAVPVYVHTTTQDETGKKQPYYQRATLALENFDEWSAAVLSAQEKLNAAEKAIHDLQIIADAKDDDDRMARLTIALRAIETARDALRN